MIRASNEDIEEVDDCEEIGEGENDNEKDVEEPESTECSIDKALCCKTHDKIMFAQHDHMKYECLDMHCKEYLNSIADNESFCPSAIIQCDGGDSLNNDSETTECDSEDEVDGDSEDDANGDDDGESPEEVDGEEVDDEEVEDEEVESNEGEDPDQTGSQIPVYLGNRLSPHRPALRTPVRQTVRRSDKLVDALSAPRLTLYNVRSAWSKLGNIAADMEMRSTDLCYLTEVWQQTENKRHQFAIEELLELKGIKYVSTPRPGARRGGGTALACSEERF